jgi:hypothetical protein
MSGAGWIFLILDIRAAVASRAFSCTSRGRLSEGHVRITLGRPALCLGDPVARARAGAGRKINSSGIHQALPNQLTFAVA